MIHPLMSIIIPVYNAEKYIERCLNSVLLQDFQDYEVIVVNDGSRDRSLEICKRLAKIHEKIRIFSTENKGVSHARNYGIRQAQGKWILFLDSDDYLIDGCLQLLEKNLDDNVQEICGNYVVNESEILKHARDYVRPEDMIVMILDPVNHRRLPAFYRLESATLLGVWGKLFSREIIVKNEIWFDEKLKLSEDMFFHIQYLKKIKNVLLLNDAIFCYYDNEASVTKKFKEEFIDNRYYLFEKLEQDGLIDAVFVTSTMLLLNIQIEQNSSGTKRRVLENRMKVFWEENRHLLVETKTKKISAGKWQNIVYKICVTLFLWGCYDASFLILRFYGKIRRR